MTIYDSDYVAEEELQQKYTGVADSVAESPVAKEEVAEEQVVSANNPEPSEKELNFRALRESIAQEKHEREAERLRYQQELEFMKSQVAQMQKPEKRILDDQQDDDLLTVGKYRQAQQDYEKMLRQQEEAYKLKVNELEAKVSNPDYDEVVEKYSIPLLQNNRDFAIGLQTAENKAKYAYELGKMYRDSQLKAQIAPAPVQETQMSRRAEKIVENASKPGTLSSARGGQPSLSKAEYYASMSEAEFNALVSKNLSEV